MKTSKYLLAATAAALFMGGILFESEGGALPETSSSKTLTDKLLNLGVSQSSIDQASPETLQHVAALFIGISSMEQSKLNAVTTMAPNPKIAETAPAAEVIDKTVTCQDKSGNPKKIEIDNKGNGKFVFVNIDKAAAEKIAEMIEAGLVAHLDFVCCGIEEQAARTIMQACRSSRSILKSLAIVSGDDPLYRELADLLKNNTTLESVLFQKSNLTDENLTCIADALKINKSLKSFNLSYAGNAAVTITGGKAIADVLKTNKSLKSFLCNYGEKNQIGHAGRRIIRDAITSNGWTQSTGTDLRKGIINLKR